jgi:hypothetical protein
VGGPYYDAGRNTYRLVVFDGTKRKSVGAVSEEAALKRMRPSESILRCGAKWVSVSAEGRLS